jgi:hypothetical protein
MKKPTKSYLLTEIEQNLKKSYGSPANYHDNKAPSGFPESWTSVQQWLNRQFLRIENYLSESDMYLEAKTLQNRSIIATGVTKLATINNELLIHFINELYSKGHSMIAVISVEISERGDMQATTIHYQFEGEKYAFMANHAKNMVVSNCVIVKST